MNSLFQSIHYFFRQSHTFFPACSLLSVGILCSFISLSSASATSSLPGSQSAVSSVASSSVGKPAVFDPRAYHDDQICCGVGARFPFIEGAFGALIMVISGLISIICLLASFAVEPTLAKRLRLAALCFFLLAVAAFIGRSLVSLFFGTDYTDYRDAS